MAQSYNERLQELIADLLEQKPIPKGATYLEAYQHRRRLEMLAQELLNEEYKHR